MSNCLLAAFSRALNLPQQLLIEEIGHDGSEIVYPDLPEPLCRRAFHAQEIILVALKHGKCVITIQKDPILLVDSEHWRVIPTNIEEIIANNNGVVAGLTPSGVPHAITKIGNQYFDPKGYSVMNLNIEPEVFYMVA